MFKKKTIFNSDLTEEVSLIDAGGGIHVSPYDTWNSVRGYTGLGINGGSASNSVNLIMAVADDPNRSLKQDDLSINTLKKYSTILRGMEIPNLKITTSSASFVSDTGSKRNTDAIIAALATSSNPDETDNAAVVCRNYSKGCIGRGQWDLPSGAALYAIAYAYNRRKSSFDKILELLEIPRIIISGGYCWSSTGYSLDKSFALGMVSFREAVDFRDNYYSVVPVYTLKKNIKIR